MIRCPVEAAGIRNDFAAQKTAPGLASANDNDLPSAVD